MARTTKHRNASRSSSISVWRPLLWVALVATLVYGRTIAFDYVQFDDDHLITKNLRYLSRPASLVDAFTRSYSFASHRGQDSCYRPLVTDSFVLDNLISPGSPHVAHLTNLLLHIIASCLVFVLIRRLGAREAVALFAAALFAAHPLASNAVGWIPGRNDLMLAVFMMMTMLSFITALERGTLRSAVVMALWFIAALLTKESAVAFIPVAAMYLLLVDRDTRARLQLPGLAAAGAVIVWMIARTLALHGAGAGSEGLWKNVLTNLPAIPQGLGKIILPVGLSVLPMFAGTLVYAAGGLAIMLIVVAVVRTGPKQRLTIAFGAVWFLAFLAPSLLSQFDQAASFLECRFYLPMIGIIVIMGVALESMEFSWKQSSFRWGASVILGVATILSLIYSAPYSDRLTLWESAVATSPESPLAHGNLGAVYVTTDREAEAEREFRAAIAINPDQPVVHHEMGAIFYNHNKFDSAEIEFRKEISVNPHYDFPYEGLGALAFRFGKAQEAVQFMTTAVAINPEFVLAWQNLARIYAAMKDAPHAAQCVGQLQKLGAEVPREVAAFLGSAK